MLKRIIAGAFLLSALPVWSAEGLWMKSAVSNLQKEKKIVEVAFANDRPTSLWISVRDDGTRRDGYAEYACLVLAQSGMPAGQFTVIHVWDAAAMARGEQTELGRYDCEQSAQ